MANWMKIAGIADGVVMAALTALGQGYPPWAGWTGIAVMALGTLGTILGGAHALSSSPTAPT